MIGFSGKIEVSSSVFWIMFQLSRMSMLTFGFLRLKVVTMTSLSVSAFLFTSRSWSWIKELVFWKCFSLTEVGILSLGSNPLNALN